MCRPVNDLQQGECVGPVMDQPAEQLEAVPRPKSDYRGLSWDRKHAGWRVRIYYRSKQRHIGRYTNEIEAAKAYDKAAYYLYGESAITNFGIHSAREDQSQVSEFIVQAKQQVQANDQRQGMHHGAGNGRAMQQLLANGMMHLQQQNHLYGTGDVVRQQAQQYTPRMMASVGSCNEIAAPTAVAPPNMVFHTSSSFSHLQSPAADLGTLNYSNSGCMVSPVASAAAQPQLLVLPTPAAGVIGAGQSGCGAAAAGPGLVGSINSSLFGHNDSVLMENIPALLQQQQQLHQFVMPAGAPQAASGSGASFINVSTPLGVSFGTSLPLLPPKVPLQQQQRPQLYDTGGAMLWQQQQQRMPQAQAHQALFCGQGEPVQLSMQPQLVSIAGHMNTPAAAAAHGSPISTDCQHEQQLLLEAQLQNMSLLDGSSHSTPPNNAWQLFSPQMSSSVGTPPAAAAAAAAAAAGVHGTTRPEQFHGNTNPTAASLPASAGAGVPLSPPCAGPILLQPGTLPQQQQQAQALRGCCHWRT